MGKRKRYGERIKIKKTLFAFFFFSFLSFFRGEKKIEAAVEFFFGNLMVDKTLHVFFRGKTIFCTYYFRV